MKEEEVRIKLTELGFNTMEIRAFIQRERKDRAKIKEAERIDTANSLVRDME